MTISNVNVLRSTGAVLAAAVLAASVGCHEDREPPGRRLPTDALVVGNSGVEARDVTAATDLFARDLLAQPALNASTHQWTIVLTDVENKTIDPTMTYNVFDSRLKSLLGQMGQGRVALIENKAKFHNLQNQELEGGGGYPAGVQPDYALYITVDQMPNRAADYYFISGTLTDLHTRQLVWTSPPFEFQSTN